MVPADGPRFVRVTKVVLATAHLDHDTTNNDRRNLKALSVKDAICSMIGTSIVADDG